MVKPCGHVIVQFLIGQKRKNGRIGCLGQKDSLRVHTHTPMAEITHTYRHSNTHRGALRTLRLSDATLAVATLSYLSFPRWFGKDLQPALVLSASAWGWKRLV